MAKPQRVSKLWPQEQRNGDLEDNREPETEAPLKAEEDGDVSEAVFEKTLAFLTSAFASSLPIEFDNSRL